MDCQLTSLDGNGEGGTLNKGNVNPNWSHTNNFDFLV